MGVSPSQTYETAAQSVTIRNLDMKLKESTLLAAIVVDENGNYDLGNGLVDVNRNIVIKLLMTIIDDKNKIKNIIGMGEVFYMWSKQKTFRLVQNARLKISLRFLPNRGAEYVSNFGNRLVWKYYGEHVFFVNRESAMSTGVFKISITATECTDTVGCAVALDDKGRQRRVDYVNLDGLNDACCIKHNCISCGYREPRTVQYTGRFFSEKAAAVRIDLELDADKHALSFFVDRVQIPHRVVCVPSSVHFAVAGGYGGLAIVLESFAKLMRPSVNPSLLCADHVWLKRLKGDI